MKLIKQAEIQLWDNQNQDYWKYIKKYKDPRTEKLKDHRKGVKSVHFNKEYKSARKYDYRKYRTQMKCLMRSEQYEFLRNYQRTSGWITW